MKALRSKWGLLFSFWKSFTWLRLFSDEFLIKVVRYSGEYPYMDLYYFLGPYLIFRVPISSVWAKFTQRMSIQCTYIPPWENLPAKTTAERWKIRIQNCETVDIVKFWLKLWNLGEIVKFGWNCEIWAKLWKLGKIVKFGGKELNKEQICEFWSKL